MFFLSQASKSMSRSDSFKDILALSRENSTSFMDNVDKMVLGNEFGDGLTFSRENSGLMPAFAKEKSADLDKLLCGTSSDITEFVSADDGDGTLGGKHPPGPRNSQAAHAADSTARAEPPLDASSDPAADLKRMGLSNLVHGLDSPEPLPSASDRPPGHPAAPPGPPEPALRGRGAPPGSRRGAHVKERPEMQRAAREGAEYWAGCVRAVRARWAERAAARPAFAAAFAGQVDAARARIKSKQECLLRFLQMAADDGLVAAGPFAPGGFFGWGRFTVSAGRAAEFRRGLEGLFPAGFREATLQETFRRAGLVPDRWNWEEAWRGGAPFEFRPRADG